MINQPLFGQEEDVLMMNPDPETAALDDDDDDVMVQLEAVMRRW